MTGKVDDGGAAFPRPGVYDQQFGGLEQGTYGMSLRDYFAGQIATGMAAYSGTAGVSYGPYEIAGRSYEVADAMLKARTRGRP